jgi:glycosyltransferase involved in cell wall biosynthesis
MSIGLPVITPEWGEWSKIIEKNNCGIITKSSSGKEFLQAIKEIKNRSEWNRISRNCKNLIRSEYNWNKLLEPLDNITESLKK